MPPRTVPIICSDAPRHIVYVPAVRRYLVNPYQIIWECSFCGARVKVVA